MTETTTRDQALTRFEESRTAFLRQLEQAPPESLGHLPEGDDYALGGLIYHVNAVLQHYQTVLQAMIDAGFTEVTPVDLPGLFEKANARARAGVDPGELGRQLVAMDELHARVLRQVSRVAEADWRRQAPVRYQAGDDPQPTSCSDVLGWLAGHYEEHVPHVEQLLDSWRATALPAAADGTHASSGYTE
jgi:hypothetical protein